MTTNEQDYRYWQVERTAIANGFVPTIDNPSHQDRDTTEPVSGFWRIMGAKTKHDTPVAIWVQEGAPGSEPIGMIAIGRKKPMAIGEVVEAEDFMTQAWFKCAAASEADYHQALETGFWSDGRPSRAMDEAEKLGIDTKPGDNNASPFETLSDQIKAAAEAADEIQPVDQASADKASAAADKLRALWKLANNERVKEKTPFDQGAKDVQAKWLPTLDVAQTSTEKLDARRKDWLRAEQKKNDDAAAAERKRLQDIRDAEAAEAAKAGDAARAAELAAAPIPAVEPQKARSGSGTGRSTGLTATRGAKIDDQLKLARHFIKIKDADFAEYLAKRAQAAARARVELPGVTITEEQR